jgi:cell wall-associated NlpC family hydrolase
MRSPRLGRALFATLLVAAGLGTGQAEIEKETVSPSPAKQSQPEKSVNALLFLSSAAGLAALEGPAVSSLEARNLVEYEEQTPAVQRLIQNALALTRQNLGYAYGSDDPSAGGMDCSGTIHYLLHQAGLPQVPRDSAEFYSWVWEKKLFRAVDSRDFDSPELAGLKPGDLLFWTGTYRIKRDPPVTHVMIYLGTNRMTGRRVMIGASDGRTFNDQPRYGVSVFDFKIPSGRGSSRLIGYSPIPGLEKIP